MTEPLFDLKIDFRIPVVAYHRDRIVRAYKRAVLEQKNKTWTSQTTIFDRPVDFTLTPKKKFYATAFLEADPMARFLRLKDVAERAVGLPQAKTAEHVAEIKNCFDANDAVMVLDRLDDFEEFLNESPEGRRNEKTYTEKGFINRFNFIRLERSFEDPEIEELAADLDRYASFYYKTNIVKRGAAFKKAIHCAEKALNARNPDKEEISQAIDEVYCHLTDSLTERRLERSLSLFIHFNRKIQLTAEQETSLKELYKDKEITLDLVEKVYSKVESFSGGNALNKKIRHTVRYDKSHWSDLLDKIEKIIDFANIALSSQTIDDLEKFSFLLTQDSPDNQKLDDVSNKVLISVLIAATEPVRDHFYKYQMSDRCSPFKIKNISRCLADEDFLQAFIHIINLKITQPDL